MTKRMTKADWLNVDWSKNNAQLAKELGKSYDTVAKKRWLLKAGPAGKPATRKDSGISKITYMPSPEQQELATKAAQASPIAGRSPKNIHAKKWVVVSPDDKVYRFINLHHFVRQNPHLFNEGDAVFKRRGGKRGTGGEYCNATAGLSNIRSGKTQSWKGWRLLKDE